MSDPTSESCDSPRSYKYVTRGLPVTFRDHGQIHLPAGLRCSMAHPGRPSLGFFLSEFPRELFPLGSLRLRDAVSKGLYLEHAHVQAVDETALTYAQLADEIVMIERVGGGLTAFRFRGWKIRISDPPDGRRLHEEGGRIWIAIHYGLLLHHLPIREPSAAMPILPDTVTWETTS